MDNDNLIVERCVICYVSKTETTGKENGKCTDGASSEGDLLNKQLIVVFLLKKFFSIPEETCCQFLERHGNPSSWIYWCDSCSVLVDEARQLFGQMTRLERKIYRLKCNIGCKMQNSSAENSGRERQEKNGINDRPTEIVRSLIVKQFPCDCYLVDSYKKEVKSEIDSYDEYQSLYESHTDIIETESGFCHNDKDEEYECESDKEDCSQSEAEGSIIVEDNSTVQSPLKEQKMSCREESSIESANSSYCPFCKIEFPNCFEFETHKDLEHPNRKIHSCSYCGKFFSQICNLKAHINTHTGERPYTCNTCDKVFKTASERRRHLVSLHAAPDQRPYQCSTCGKSFRYKRSLKDHVNIHDKNNPFRCTTCGKNLLSFQSHSNHMKSHSEKEKERPFLCTTCGTAFYTAGELKFHEKLHTGEKTHCCQFCGRKFASKGNLTSHERIHKGEKRFECSFCQERFFKGTKLRRHLRTHTGEPPPHKCSFCDKRFEDANEVKTHERVHTGERPFSCPICQKSFPFRKSKTRHVKMVHDKIPGPHSCSICGKRYYGKKYLKLHERTHQELL